MICLSKELKRFIKFNRMEFLLATTINCTAFNAILMRLYKNLQLTTRQKLEVVKELKEYVKICPLPQRNY